MDRPPKPFRPRVARNAAMKNDQRHGDERRDRGRDGRGVNNSRRSPSPPRRPRPAGAELVARQDRPDRPHERHPDKSQPSYRHRHRSRDRSKERPPRPSHSSSRRHRDRDDHRNRDRSRDAGSQPDGRGGQPPKASSRSRSRGRGQPLSPPPSKRPRSRSPSPASHHRKKSKHDPRERRIQDESNGYPESLRLRRHSSHPHRSLSPSPRDHKPRSKDKPDDLSAVRRDNRSRSPLQDCPPSSSARPRSSRSHRDHPEHGQRSRSPVAGFRRHPPSGRHSLSPHPNRPGRSSSVASQDRAGPDFDGRPPYPPRSPRGYRSRGGKGRPFDEARFSSKFEPPSGSNKEADMAARGGYRGGYHPNQQSFPHKSQYNDPRGFSQSPQHATPGSSFQNSPSTQSPYGGGRGGWGGQQYSPPHQYPPQYQHGSYGPPNGPQGYYSNSPQHSAPTGPMQPYTQGNYRGAYRGGRGGFRGNHFDSGRGGYRANNFKSAQWNANAQGQGPRGQYNGEEANSQQASGTGTPNETGDTMADPMDVDQNPFRPSKDLQVEDSTKAEANGDGKMAPPTSRAPPSGPGSSAGPSSKFSFAFKASAKPTPATPKPEISQKFNAAPQRREPFPNDNRDRVPPRSAPTEPASARSRHVKFEHPPAPRVRKVKKTMKRPKPRPTLDPDLASSTSVYYRKPGNESIVGSGTYGKVFKGLHVYTKQHVALKKIRMEGEKDGFPVTAIREIKLLQSLRHTNIVRLLEVMVEKDDCFMVFEYLSHDLTGLLNHPTFKLDPAQKKHLAMQLFEGLDYLHNKGVLHRDIKAANILVSSDGILKLADFGLARFYAKRHQLDYTNRVITIWYRCPELLLGETKYGAAADIWSAACVMMEIFTRGAIFPGDGGEISQLDKLYSVIGTPNTTEWPGLVDMPWFALLKPGYRKPSTFAEKYKSRLPPAGFELLSAMFRYDPDKRPTAAEALAHPYFTTEEPLPRQAVELQNLDGDWHEFESKALRRENERRDREARRSLASKDSGARERDKKRVMEGQEQRETKRAHVEKAQHTADRERGTAAADGNPQKKG